MDKQTERQQAQLRILRNCVTQLIVEEWDLVGARAEFDPLLRDAAAIAQTEERVVINRLLDGGDAEDALLLDWWRNLLVMATERGMNPFEEA